MKKSHDYNELSDVVCDEPGCKKKLKLRVVQEKPTAKKCYQHYRTRRLAHTLKPGSMYLSKKEGN